MHTVNKIQTFHPARRRGYESSRTLLIFCLLITVLLCLTAASNTATAATYYLDAVNGDDSNPGTIELPWKTIARAEEHAANGSTIYLATGNYGDVIIERVSSGRSSWQEGITFIPQSGHNPVLRSLYITGNVDSYITFDDISIIRPDPDFGYVVFVRNGGYIKFLNCEIQGVINEKSEEESSTLCVIALGEYNGLGIRQIIVENCHVSYSEIGISIKGPSYDGIVIRGSHIHNTYGSTIKLVSITNNTIYIKNNHIHTQSLLWGVHASGLEIRSENLTIRGNIIRACGGTAPITMYEDRFPEHGYRNMVFENNLVYDSLNLANTVRLYDIGNNFVFNNNTMIGVHEDGRTGPYYYNNIVAVVSYAQDCDPSTVEICNNIFVGYTGAFDLNTISTGNLFYAYLHDSIFRDQDWMDTNFPGNKVYNTDQGNEGQYEFGTSGVVFKGGSLFDTYAYTVLHGVDLEDSFELAAGSDANGFANPAYAPNSDILGVSRVFPPDAGCYEYVGLEYVGLVGHWKFNDGDGISATDSSGNNNTATLINGPVWTGQGELSFDGIDDAVEIPTANWNVSSGTITLWAKAADLSGTRYLFGHNVGSWTNMIQLYTDEGSLCLGLGGSHSLHPNIENLALQTWYHIALTWDGTDYVVYVDGIAKASGPYTGLTALNTFADIGNDGNASFRNEAFNGIIDEVRVYNRALIADEVSNLALVFLPIDDKEVEEGLTLTFKVRTKDPNQEVLIESHSLPSDPVFFLNGGSWTFSWTPQYGDAGSYEVTFEAPHGEFVDFETITITVHKPTKPVYRFWSPTNSRHFYTIKESEKDKLIDIYAHVWTYESIAYYAFAEDSEPGLVPVYRFWSPVLVAHFYTISESEKQKLIDRYSHVWTYEGIAFYTYPEGQQPGDAEVVYRFWSPVLETHFYTIRESEKNKLVDNYSHVWTYEGTAWYAYTSY